MPTRLRSEGFATWQPFRGDRPIPQDLATALAPHQKGFFFTFPNGYRVSVQFGLAKYCERYDMDDYLGEPENGTWTSKDAEVAIFDPKGNWFHLDERWEGDDVIGHQSVMQVLDILNKVAALPKED